jgi:hypothetical protein
MQYDWDIQNERPKIDLYQYLAPSISTWLLPRVRSANLSLPLAQNRVWSAGHRYTGTFAVFLPTGCVINLATDLNGIHPHKVIGLNEPLSLELFLADRAGRMGDDSVLGNGYISVLCLLFDAGGRP